MQFTPDSRLKLSELEEFLQWLEMPDTQPVRDHNLFLTAFIHKSYACDYIGDYAHNERLEFLGDGIFGAIVNKFLFCDFAHEPESTLTLYKIKLVREETLAQVAQDIWLDAVILLWNWEEKQWWRNKKSVLSDCCEAFIGYLYLDQSIDVVEYFVRHFVYTKLEDVKNNRYKSYKSLLQELVQERKKILPEYYTYEHELDVKNNAVVYKSEVSVQWRIIWTWTAKNKKWAEEEAANVAYDNLKK